VITANNDYRLKQLLHHHINETGLGLAMGEEAVLYQD
jgi:hypothetical protein